MIRIEDDSLFAYSTEFSKNLVRVSLVKHPFGEIPCFFYLLCYFHFLQHHYHYTAMEQSSLVNELCHNRKQNYLEIRHDVVTH